MKTFKKLLSDAWGYNRGLFAYFGVNVALTALFAVTTLLAPRMLMQEILTGARVQAILWIAVIFLFVTGVSGFFTSYIKADYLVTLKEFRATLLRRAQRKDLTRSYADLENPQKQDEAHFAQRAVTNFSTGAEGICSRLYTMSANLVTAALYVWVLFALNLWIGLFLVAGSALLYLYSRGQNAAILMGQKEITPYDRKNWYLSEVTTKYEYGKDIRVFGIAGWLREKYEAVIAVQRNMEGRFARVRSRMALADVLFTLVRSVLVYGYLIHQILQGRIGLADFTMYFTAVTLFSAVLKQFSDDAAFISVELESVTHYYAFVERPDEYELSGQDSPPVAPAYEIAFEDVSFQYPGTDRYVFENLSFTIRAGEKLAIVGINGAGKSTIVKLMVRLYKPDKGRILLNGIDIQTMELRAYRELFSVVFQDINLIATTLGENVALRETYDAQRAEQALRDAGFADKLDSFEKGLGQQILKSLQEDGVELSGGEKQKLAIARALYRDGHILIFDEPTAALDAIAEYEFYIQFAEATRGKTAVFISHRLASTRFCDNILLLGGDGQCEFGTHEALMAQCGAYHRMYTTQMKYYNEEVAR